MISSTASLLIFGTIAATAIGGVIFACDRWFARRRKDSENWRFAFAHAGFVSGMVFCLIVLKGVPWHFQDDPWALFEGLVRLCLCLGAGFLLHELLLKILFRP